MTKPTIRELLETREIGHNPVMRLQADDRIAERVEAVLKLHKMMPGEMMRLQTDDRHAEWHVDRGEHCLGCSQSWPCATIRALDGE